MQKEREASIEQYVDHNTEGKRNGLPVLAVRKLTIFLPNGGFGLAGIYLVGIIEYEIVQDTHSTRSVTNCG